MVTMESNSRARELELELELVGESAGCFWGCGCKEAGEQWDLCGVRPLEPAIVAAAQRRSLPESSTEVQLGRGRGVSLLLVALNPTCLF
jgi:hypothetical protein